MVTRIRCSTGNHRNRLTLGTQLPQIADSISYGVGMRYKSVEVVRLAGDDPAASRMSRARSAAELKTHDGTR